MTQQEYENEIKELKERIKKLEMVKIEEPQLKRWDPDCGEIYWCVTGKGDVNGIKFDNDLFDEWHYLTGNCFKTEEEAEEHRKKIEYTARYKNYIEEHSEPIDWNDSNAKYFLIYDYKNLQIESMFSVAYKVQNTICASSEKILFEAINEIGEDNFKKYVLGVK